MRTTGEIEEVMSSTLVRISSLSINFVIHDPPRSKVQPTVSAILQGLLR